MIGLRQELQRYANATRNPTAFRPCVN